jgi:RNA polymerase sigma factor (sigma-70 family)
MPEASDMMLVRQYADHHSEPAFAELVHRHVNLVYSVALRRTGNAADAQDVAQAVFIIFAQKAAQLRNRAVLTGWLYETTRFTSTRLLRTRARQQNRDQEAYMQSTLHEPDPDGVWRQLAPHLEDAMARLGERDRTLLALRFFENKSAPEAAAALGINEAAAHKRTSRALDKLRQFFSRSGIVLSAAAIVGAVSANSVQAAPSGLAQTISSVALAKGAAAGGSTLTLANGALKLMAWTKTKAVVIAGVMVLLAAGTTTFTLHQFRKPAINLNDFWATTYPTGTADIMQNFASRQSYALVTTFPPEPVQLCSISGLLNQCMELSGWQYLIDKSVAPGSVEFGGSAQPLNGEQWLAAFENALQTKTPEWWDAKTKKFRRENLVLIRYPNQKIVLVLPPEKAAEYQYLAGETATALAKKLEPPAPGTLTPEAAFQQESTNQLNQAMQWGMACRLFAQEHNGHLPENMAQLKNYSGGLPDTNWEMVSGGSWDGIHNPSATILLREKAPRQGPDGTFVKVYTFADGRAQLNTSRDDDFAAMEQQRGFLVHSAGN